MSFPTGMVGFRATTPKKFVLRSGAAFRDLNLTKLRSEGWTAAIDPANTWADAMGITRTPAALGATRNGAKVDPGKVAAQIDVDGAYVPILEFDKVTSYAPVLTVTLLEVSDVDTAMMFLGSADRDEWSAASYDEVTPSLEIGETNYLGNVAIAARVSDKDVTQPYLIVLDYPIVMDTTEITLQDDPGEAAVEVKFAARAPLANPHDVPIHYFLPRSTGSGS